MTEYLKTAVKRLKEGGYTCVLVGKEREAHSTLRGVRPLLELLDSGEDFHGFCAADKTVGAGAAHLYLLLGVSDVWARVMSRRAKELLESHGVSVLCEEEVPYIINRAGDGMCPIEAAVKNIASPEEALIKIRKTVRKLSGT